ncbi:MAG: flagellar hook-associated protein FlgL [Candidatus Binatota bacterium]|nr:flagellar hook-associated protein FlgL [Candidatus Binatota bacterium]
MRITQQTISTQVTEGLQRSFQRLARTQEAVTSGRRINHLSDDPIGATRVLELRGFGQSLTQYEKNLNTALPAFEQADSVLDNVIDRLVRAKELALAMANDSNSPDQRLQTSKEVRELLNQVLSLANTKVENRFIFAGFVNGTPPFSEGGGVVSYSGDSGEVLVQTSAASSIPMNVPGDKVFQGVGLGTGVDIFDICLDLESALQNNDISGASGIRTQIGRLDVAVDQILRFRAEFGARVNNAQVAKDAIGIMKIQNDERRSQIEDADALAVYSDFARYQQAFQAALQSASQLIQPSLLDFLR